MKTAQDTPRPLRILTLKNEVSGMFIFTSSDNYKFFIDQRHGQWHCAAYTICFFLGQSYVGTESFETFDAAVAFAAHEFKKNWVSE